VAQIGLILGYSYLSKAEWRDPDFFAKGITPGALLTAYKRGDSDNFVEKVLEFPWNYPVFSEVCLISHFWIPASEIHKWNVQ